MQRSRQARPEQAILDSLPREHKFKLGKNLC